MGRGESSASPRPARAALVSSRFVGPILASISGCSIVLYMLYAAGANPWLWWSAYRDRTTTASVAEVRRPPASGVVQPKPSGADSSVSQVSRRLILSATRRGRNAQNGTASIGVNAASPQTFRAGALLANGARIAEMDDDAVVLLQKAGVS